MSAHDAPEYATATGNDYPAHEQMYKTFTYLILIGIILAVNICLGLTVGGVKGNWWFAIPFIFVAHLAAVASLMTESKMPSYVLLAVGLLGLALA
jgi:hypothetical protein